VAGEPVRRLLLTAAAGLVAASAAPVLAGADEFPTLPPGSAAVMTGSHVSCTVTATSVSCTKAGGLTATLAASGAVHVTRGSRTLFAAVKPKQLHTNGGFILSVGDQYCHVYVAGVPTIDCSLTSANPPNVPNTEGFDMSDRSVVVFRFDKTGYNRHDIKTFPEP
jgi:hypothetical protein